MVIHGTTDNTSVTANTPAILVDSTGRVAVAGPTGTSANQVQGTAADGAAVAGNPVRIAGKDGSGNTQDLITDTTGNLSVGTGTAGSAATNVVTVQGIASATPVIVGGAVASGAADSGNPIKVGGVYTSTLPTITTGQRVDLQLSDKGLVIPAGTYDGTAGGDGRSGLVGFGYRSMTSIAVAPIPMAIGEHQLNAAGTWDRKRGNLDTAALITAAAATTDQTSADQTNYNGRGVKVVLDMTTVGTGSVTITIQGKDAASGKYYTLLQGAAVVTNSTNVYEVYPGVAVAANASASTVLPRTWRVITTANNANATTYTVGASVIL